MSGSRSGPTPAAADVDVEGPLLSDGYLEDRAYQRQLAATACTADTLVCLPTGLGKTAVSLLVTAARLHESDHGKALLLAPTKPLTRQHATFYREALEIRTTRCVCSPVTPHRPTGPRCGRVRAS